MVEVSSLCLFFQLRPILFLYFHERVAPVPIFGDRGFATFLFYLMEKAVMKQYNNTWINRRQNVDITYKYAGTASMQPLLCLALD